MKTLNLRNIAALALAATVLMGLPTRAHAVPQALNFNDIHSLGQVLFGIPSGDQDRTNYVNFLIGMTPGTSASAQGQTFNRSLVSCGTCPAAVNSPTTLFNGTNTTISLGVGGFDYLFAKYDGPNAGAEVWNVQGLTGDWTIPAN